MANPSSTLEIYLMLGEKDDSYRVCIIDANLVERLDLAKLPSLLPSSIAIETFEYIDLSSASSLQLRLPNYAGIFFCFLLRSHQDGVGAVILAKSSIFSILFPLQFSSPTKLYGSTGYEGIRTTFPLVTRRGASPLLDNISFLPVSILVENMSNIGTISINGTLKENKTQRTTTLNRLRVWWSRDVLYIEFDVYDVINSSSSCIFFKLDLVNSHTFSFLSSSSFASINDTQTSFSVRLVYDRSLSPYMPITSSVEKAASCLPAGLICGFCGHIVVEESKLTEVRDLPSGTFDHVSIFCLFCLKREHKAGLRLYCISCR